MKTRMLPVHLTDTEILTKADQLSRAYQEMQNLQVRKKVLAADLKVEIDRVKECIGTLSRCIATRSEERPVEVELRPLRDRRVVEEYRVDTGEIVGTRAMSDADVQVPMFETPPPAAVRKRRLHALPGEKTDADETAPTGEDR